MVFATIGAPAMVRSSGEAICPAIDRGAASPGELDRFYVGRVAAILKAGAVRDATGLGTLVGDECDCEIWRGDVSITGRAKGVAAVIRLIERLGSRT